MRIRIAMAVVTAAVIGFPLAPSARGYGPRSQIVDPGPSQSVLPTSGRAPWNAPWEYDSGGDNDRRPELPYYMQGRGQQTGGPARNLIPDDRLQIFPR